jgi:tetratricopeptide (TPR) repeat protein
MARRTGDDFVLGYALLGQGWLAYDEGRYDETVQAARAALPGFERIRHGSGVGFVHEQIGIALRAAGRYPESAAELALAVRRFERLGDRARAGRGRFYRAETLLSAGRPDEARAEWARAEGIVGDVPPPEALHSRERLRKALGAPDGSARDADGGEVPAGAGEADGDKRGEQEAAGPR